MFNIRRKFALIAVILVPLIIYAYPVGGRIWGPEAVDSVVIFSYSGGLRESRNREAITEAFQAARLDRFRRLLPGAFRCTEMGLEFRDNTGRKIPVGLRCASGLLFDAIPRDAWTNVGL